MSKLRAFFDSLDVSKRGYRVNKWLTNGAFVLLLLYMAFIVHIDGVGVLNGSSFYLECPSDSLSVCFNPYFSEFGCDNDYCEHEFLFAGESFGSKPSLFARTFGLVAILFIGGSLFLNHLLYNKKFKVCK